MDVLSTHLKAYRRKHPGMDTWDSGALAAVALLAEGLEALGEDTRMDAAEGIIRAVRRLRHRATQAGRIEDAVVYDIVLDILLNRAGLSAGV